VLTLVLNQWSAMDKGAEVVVCEMGEFCIRLGTLVGAEWVCHSSAMRGSVKVRPASDKACDNCSILGDWEVTSGMFQAWSWITVAG
jgi:hypothetical protein